MSVLVLLVLHSTLLQQFQILAHDSTETEGGEEGGTTCTLGIPKSTFVTTEECYLHHGLGPHFNVGVAV
jgi:hypothetical protein